MLPWAIVRSLSFTVSRQICPDFKNLMNDYKTCYIENRPQEDKARNRETHVRSLHPSRWEIMVRTGVFLWPELSALLTHAPTLGTVQAQLRS
jgi:hypothetical protein